MSLSASPSSRKSPPLTTKHNPHAPLNPSQLREVHLPSSPSDAMSGGPLSHHPHDELEIDSEGIHPFPDHAIVLSNDDNAAATTDDLEPTLRTRLLSQRNWDQASVGGSDGAFSPRPYTHRSYGSIGSDGSRDGFGGRYPRDLASPSGESVTHALLGDTVAERLLGSGSGNKMSRTKYLAKRHGIRNRRLMYLAYYIPVLNWIRQYKRRYLRGDFVAALTMASFYIPMSLSYATNLGHVPPVNGLYSFVINPLIYALLGTCPQMVVGPEAAGSLLTGEVVRENIRKGTSGDEDGIRNAEIAGIVTCMAGAFIFTAGIFRLGFLDNVLSRPFLRGFISAIGVVIFVDQLIPEMGLAHLGKEASHGSCLDKIIFLVHNAKSAHGLTCAVSFGAFGIIMFFREIKKRLQPRYPNVAYIPDRFLVVVLSAVFAWRFGWAEKGVEILGSVQAGGKTFAVHFPLETSHLKYASDAVNTALIIALLGFFESSVAAKSLPSSEGQKDGIKNMALSANRELIALGTANMVGGLFMSLPAFGGYGRSKVNASTGGTTPMSSIFLSLITTFCIFFMLPYFYYIPKGVLCAMVSVVAYSLVEEAPHDIKFFWRIRGISEMTLMFAIFLTTIFWDLKRGIAVGIGLSLLRVLRHSTRPRIQILGRVPGTTDKFMNAELDPDNVEFIEGCLIVKIPEPLTFANTGDLKNRLRRLEAHGTSAAHPALPRIRREEHNKNVIFDVHGVTSLDGAGAQVLSEIVNNYRDRDVRVFFCRVPGERSDVWRLFEQSGIVEMCGGRRHFVSSVEHALSLIDLESLTEEFRERED
ncbi:hypothetical protein GQ43DRAFT_195818 [Delitschia confertaspora ATCC 74209]|uniref:STAS domain-containing protein n=1 Tax=Delitschia confertaspora ATCC 74209 TaxID=1513339 RepID=A0A9P4JDW7_9PLEO|nr:hypothetical protein GQ43DRAFT_195818 [Delitschia confertaspora ATCC 74209]